MIYGCDSLPQTALVAAVCARKTLDQHNWASAINPSYRAHICYISKSDR